MSAGETKLVSGEGRFSRDNPSQPPQSWDNGTWSIQKWLERTAWRTLKDTEYGRTRAESGVCEAIFTDKLLRQVYLIDIALFVGAERTSYKAVAGLLQCAPDEVSQIYLGTQVLDECRHFEVFCRRMADMGVSPTEREALVARYCSKPLMDFYDLLLEQVDKRDFIAGALAQNIVMEGMAYPIYRYEIKYWSRIDPSLSQIIRGAFADEAHHVGFGEAIVREHLARAGDDDRRKLKKLLAQFSGLMTEAFECVIGHYIGLYQECANRYLPLMGDVEIFPNRTIAATSEEEQVRLLLDEIKREHEDRTARVGIA